MRLSHYTSFAKSKEFWNNNIKNIQRSVQHISLGYSEIEIQNKAKPAGYWDKEENIKAFLNELKNKYKLSTGEDWNKISKKEIYELGGSRLFSKYSLYEIKVLGYPKGENLFSKRKRNIKPKGYWSKEENIKEFLQKLKNVYQLDTKDAWNNLSKHKIQKLAGNGLFSKYNVQEIKLLGCPELKLFFPSNNDKSAGFWDSKENLNSFLQSIANEFQLKTPNDWNQLTCNQIKSLGGSTLLNKHSINEIRSMGNPNYADMNFDKKSFTLKPKGFWDKLENIQSFLLLLKSKYNLESAEDWNNITQQHIHLLGGGSLFSKFSLFDLKVLACPEVKEKFADKNRNITKPHGFWDKKENIKGFLDNFKLEFHLHSPDDWNRISRQQIYDFGGNGLLKYSLFEMLSIAYPEIHWDKTKLNKTDKRSAQRFLYIQVASIFSGVEIIEDYFHSELTRITGFTVQFDIFIPEKNIAFEYHGKHHFEDTPHIGFGSLEMYKSRDIEKEKICKENNIKLVIIPHWWDNSIDSLHKLIENATTPNIDI